MNSFVVRVGCVGIDRLNRISCPSVFGRGGWRIQVSRTNNREWVMHDRWRFDLPGLQRPGGSVDVILEE